MDLQFAENYSFLILLHFFWDTTDVNREKHWMVYFTVEAFDCRRPLFCRFFGMTAACMPSLYKLGTFADSLSRNANSQVLYTFNDTEGMYIYWISLSMHTTDNLTTWFLLLIKKTYVSCQCLIVIVYEYFSDFSLCRD